MKRLSDHPLLGGLLASIAATTIAMLGNLAFAAWAFPGMDSGAIVGAGIVLVFIGWFYMGMFFRQQKRSRNESQLSNPATEAGQNFEHNKEEADGRR